FALAHLERHLVELAPQILDARAVRISGGIFVLELRLLGRLLSEIGHRQAAAEHFVAADLELGLVLRRQIVADRLKIADEVVERGIFADVDEVFDASRHGKALWSGIGDAGVPLSKTLKPARQRGRAANLLVSVSLSSGRASPAADGPPRARHSLHLAQMTPSSHRMRIRINRPPRPIYISFLPFSCWS